MSASITITYDLKPPTGIEANSLRPSAVHEFEIPVSPKDGQKSYYAALEAVIVKAKDQVGIELTAWRDAIGKAELTKEPRSSNSEEGDDESEEDWLDNVEWELYSSKVRKQSSLGSYATKHINT